MKLKPAAGYLEFGLKAGNRREQMKQYQCCCFSSAFIKFKWDSLNLKPGRQAVSFLLFPFFTALAVASYLPYHSPLKSGRHGGKKSTFPKIPSSITSHTSLLQRGVQSPEILTLDLTLSR